MFGQYPKPLVSDRETAIIARHGNDVGYAYNFRQEIGFVTGLSAVISAAYAGAAHLIPALSEHRPVLQIAHKIGGDNLAAHFSENNFQNFAISAAVFTVYGTTACLAVMAIPKWRKILEKDRLKMWVKIGQFAKNHPVLRTDTKSAKDVRRGYLAAERLKELRGRRK